MAATKVKDTGVSVEDKLMALYNLQHIDSKIDKIKTLKGELPMEVEDLEDEITGLTARLSNLEKEIEKHNDESVARNEMIKECKNLIEKYEKQSKNVKNSREFEALTKEIELQKLEIQLCEKKIREAKAFADQRTVMVDDVKAKLNWKQTSYTEKKGELDKIVKDTEVEEQTLKHTSDKARVDIEPRLMMAYDRMRKNYKNGLAVVPVLRDACGGCFNKIPAQLKIEIKTKKKIITCEHCSRVLIDNEEA